jgi:PhnB protein
MSVSAVPKGYHNVTPYLAIDGAAKAIDYYAKVFGARERMRFEAPGGKIGHAEIQIGDAIVMLADPWPEGNFLAPQGSATSVSLHIYVDDADAVFARAIDSGSKSVQKMETKFYGDRSGTVRDPFGHMWHISTHVEDVPEEEMQRRMKEMPDVNA